MPFIVFGSAWLGVNTTKILNDVREYYLERNAFAVTKTDTVAGSNSLRIAKRTCLQCDAKADAVRLPMHVDIDDDSHSSR